MVDLFLDDNKIETLFEFNVEIEKHMERIVIVFVAQSRLETTNLAARWNLGAGTTNHIWRWLSLNMLANICTYLFLIPVSVSECFSFAVSLILFFILLWFAFYTIVLCITQQHVTYVPWRIKVFLWYSSIYQILCLLTMSLNEQSA